MSTSYFRAGIALEIDKRPYVLLRVIDKDRWQIEDGRTKEIVTFPFAELISLYVDKRLVFAKPISANKHVHDRKFISKIPEDAKIRRAYVQAVIDLPSSASILRPIIKKIWEKINQPKHPPNPVTVIRWKNRYLSSGKNIMALISNVEHRGNKKPRYPQSVMDAVKEAIEKTYLTLERRTIEDTLHTAKLNVKRENSLLPPQLALPMPTRRLIKGQIEKIPAYECYVARYGKTAADIKFRAVLGHRTTSEPLERAEIDHTIMDLFVVDDNTFVPMGRPYLTTCIDDHTRSILGINISFQPPSYISVARCLKNCFFPKFELNKKYPSIKNAWKQCGIMSELVVDNGAEFHSDALELACNQLGIEIHYADRKNGAFKGKIERFQGSFNRSLAHSSPGTTFSNIFERDDYDPVKHAVIRYSKLKELVYLWIVDYYHQKPHRGIGDVSPAALWDNLVDISDIRFPDNPAHIDAIMGRPEKRRLTHSGISLDNLFYNSQDLQELRMRCGNLLDVDIRINDDDLGTIFVIAPDGKNVINVKALKYEYAGGLLMD